MWRVRAVRRVFARLVPTRFRSRRDRLSPEADRIAIGNQFRSGI